MTLRLRLFLLFGGLVALLVVAQWWWVRVLTRDLSSEIDQVASSVGQSVAAFFVDFDLNDVEAAPHGRVLECLGEGREAVSILDENVDITHQVAFAHTGAENENESAADAPPTSGEPTEAKVLIRRFRRDDSSEGTGEPIDTDESFAYSFRLEDHDTEGVTQKGAKRTHAPAVSRQVELHVEHQGSARYLMLGGPNIERRVRIPQGFREKLDRFSRRLVLGSAGFLVLGLVLAGVVAHRVTTPLRRLSDAARRLGEGALGTQVPLTSTGEVGEALVAFNRMSGRLEELDRQTRELSARKHLGEIGEIARGFAHTLRNPLNALGLSVEELASLAGGGAAVALTESARRQIRRIDSSLKSFLALASQSGGVLAEVDLGELVEDVALEALQDARGKARLKLELAAGMPRLRASRPELRAVLQALVVNAIEASPEGGRVTVRSASPEAGHWRLEIEDQGPGLDPDVRRRLFTPHLSTKANGSGMGLFLAHRIATGRYGGSLELVDHRSDDGKVQGTRVILDLGERAGDEAGHDATGSLVEETADV